MKRTVTLKRITDFSGCDVGNIWDNDGTVCSISSLFLGASQNSHLSREYFPAAVSNYGWGNWWFHLEPFARPKIVKVVLITEVVTGHEDETSKVKRL